MKHIRSFFILITLTLLVCIFWLNTGFQKADEIDKESYISKKVLELSVPFDVRINVEFLKSLETIQSTDASANESSRTSPEGI